MTTAMTLSVDQTISGPSGTSHLTSKEFALLVAIVSRKGSLLTKQAALTEIYGGRDEPELKIIDVFVCKIRNKLRAIGIEGRAVETVWGQGYRLAEDFKVNMPDSGFVSLEADPDLIQRIEDLALATGQNVSALLNRIVSENLLRYEEEAWKC